MNAKQALAKIRKIQTELMGIENVSSLKHPNIFALFNEMGLSITDAENAITEFEEIKKRAEEKINEIGIKEQQKDPFDCMLKSDRVLEIIDYIIAGGKKQ